MLLLLLAGIASLLIAAVVLYPTLLNVFQGKLSSKTSSAQRELWNEGIFNIPRRLFIGQYDSITNSGTPNIFCGMVSGIFASVYLLGLGAGGGYQTTPKACCTRRICSAYSFVFYRRNRYWLAYFSASQLVSVQIRISVLLLLGHDWAQRLCGFKAQRF